MTNGLVIFSVTMDNCSFPLEKEVHKKCYTPGDNPLITAACLGHKDCLNSWIEAGVDVNKTNKRGETALMQAAERGCDKCVKILLDAGASVSARSNENSIALHFASWSPDLNMKSIDLLLQEGADVNNADDDGRRPLHYAAGHENTDHVQKLIDAGADVNVKDSSRETPLMRAAFFGRKEAIELLLKTGCEVNCQDNRGLTALFVAADDCVEYLLKTGADVNIVEKLYGYSPLMAAALKNQSERLVPLLRAGADVNSTNRKAKGNTALMAAAIKGYDICVKILIEEGANVNATCDGGFSALKSAARYGNFACLQHLITAGADVNIVNLVESAISTALTDATVNGHLKCVKLLLKANVLLNRCKLVPGSSAIDPDLVDLIDRNIYYSKYAPLIFTSKNARSVMLMFAAGEILNDDDLQKMSTEEKDSLQIFEIRHEDRKMGNLRHLCRKAIRKHLLKLNPYLHLFNRIPQLGLPHAETQYLLFDMSLDLESDENFERLD